MAKIKSALELALEKTESIAGDPEKIRKSELEKKGKRIMGAYLFDYDTGLDDLKSTYEKVAEIDQPVVHEQMVETLLTNISLPQDDLYVESLGRVKKAVEYLAGESEELTDLFVQTDQLYQQYLNDREQLLERAKQQYEPHRKQKEEQTSQKIGRPIKIQAEQDPDFIKMLEANYKRLEDNYQQGIAQIKEHLRAFIT